MEEFSYYNIFDTKGIEYLVVIAFLLLLIPFWLMLNKPLKVPGTVGATAGFLNAGLLRIPQGVFISRNHLWTFLQKTGTALLGLDDFLIHVTGKVRVNYLKRPGETIKKGELVAEILKEDRKLSIFSPLTGKVISSNTRLTEQGEILPGDPYEAGWLYTVKPANWLTETRSFHFADEAVNWFKREMERYREFLTASLSRNVQEVSYTIMQDGGVIASESLSYLPHDSWKEFEKEFMKL